MLEKWNVGNINFLLRIGTRIFTDASNADFDG